jgi:hypothetical protein
MPQCTPTQHNNEKQKWEKRPISNLYKELLKLTNKKTNNLITKQTKSLHRYLTKENIQRKNKHIKMLNIICHWGIITN